MAATSGMTQAIFEQLRANLGDDIASLEEKDRTPIEDGWRKLAHAIATGVITHIRSSLEVRDPESPTNAAPVLDVTGSTGTADAAPNHSHGAGQLRVTLAGFAFH